MTDTDVRTTPASGTSSDYAVLRGLVLATFIVILNETIMGNAIPGLMTEFEVTARAAQWLSTSFMLTMAVVIPVTGWFLQRVTTRAAFGLAMAVFCAGTALMFPLLMTTLMTTVPAYDRGRITGNVTLAMSVAPALGPAVSGVVLEHLSWRWMFGLVLPVAAVIGLVGLHRLTNIGEHRVSTLDWFSVVLSAVGFGGFVYGLSQLGASYTGPVPPVAIVLAGLAAIGVFVWRQLFLQRTGELLLDLRTLRRRTYAVSLALMSVAFMAMLGSMILLPLYLQDVRHLSALQTGALVARAGSRWACSDRPSAGCSTGSAAASWSSPARSASWSR